MTYQLTFTKEFSRQFKKLDRSVQERVRKGVDVLAQDPTAGKRLTGLLSDRWSYRVGDYRILYKIHHDRLLVLVLTVGHRREIYR